ncbi:MAG: hypothetical protein IKH30_13975 [Clostridia bacterium]|nr:hypothetical protein [Clostridia bacterium]
MNDPFLMVAGFPLPIIFGEKFFAGLIGSGGHYGFSLRPGHNSDIEMGTGYFVVTSLVNSASCAVKG